MFLFTLICLLLIALYGVLIEYYRRAWKSMPAYSPGPGIGSPVTSISVIIPARNEEKNIAACLESLSRQSYPRSLYEVIVVDDFSSDGTAAIVKQHEDVKYLRLADYTGPDGAIKAYKKLAIETGIGVAKGRLIVTTDADCRSHPDWLRTIAGFYEKTGAMFIAAPVKINAGNSFLALFQALDFITLQGITGAAVHKKFHSMCNGANLAYEKKAFYEVDGFRGIDQIPSGDDMLLMHKIYKKYPGQVFFLKNQQAIISTKAETSWRGFVHQRVRWASKAGQYDDKRIIWVLVLVYAVNLLFAGLLLASLLNYWYLWVLLVLLLIKTIIEYPFVRTVAFFFGEQRLMVYFPVLQPFHIVYTVVIGWLGKFGSYRWKGRKS